MDFFILDSDADNQQVSIRIEYRDFRCKIPRGESTSLVHVRRERKTAFENVIYLGQIIIVNKRHKWRIYIFFLIVK